MTPEDFMRRAIEISARALTEPGTEPFGAVVVKDGRIVGEGINRSLADLDPTSHGETEAIRDACRNLGTVELRGCEIYTSCEPCPLCVAAMVIAGISRLSYAAGMGAAGAAFADLSEAQRFPVDVDLMRSECGSALQARRMPAEQILAGEAASILRDWARSQSSDRR